MDISSIVALPTDWTSVHLLEFVEEVLAWILINIKMKNEDGPRERC